MMPLQPSSTIIDWQFNSDGKPAVMSQALLQRSQYIAQCIQSYSDNLGMFALRYSKAASFISERASLVDYAHARAVAASMLDTQSRKAINLLGRLRVEIGEEQVQLDRLRSEYRNLRAVQNQQLLIIKNLERGSL